MCGACGREYEVPQHCNQAMVLDEDGMELKCEVCGEKKPLPRCCGSPLEFED